MKRAQLNQTFIYLFSVIIVVFIAFLVGRFVFTFTGDVEQRQDVKLYETLRQDYDSVYRTYGSEKVYDYRVSSNVANICFVESTTCIGDLTNLTSSQQQELEIIVQNGDNVIVFDEVGVESSSYIGSFINEESLCFCIQPRNQFFSLVMTNERNQVIIEEN